MTTGSDDITTSSSVHSQQRPPLPAPWLRGAPEATGLTLGLRGDGHSTRHYRCWAAGFCCSDPGAPHGTWRSTEKGCDSASNCSLIEWLSTFRPLHAAAPLLLCSFQRFFQASYWHTRNKLIHLANKSCCFSESLGLTSSWLHRPPCFGLPAAQLSVAPEALCFLIAPPPVESCRHRTKTHMRARPQCKHRFPLQKGPV